MSILYPSTKGDAANGNKHFTNESIVRESNTSVKNTHEADGMSFVQLQHLLTANT